MCSLICSESPQKTTAVHQTRQTEEGEQEKDYFKEREKGDENSGH